MSFDTVGRIFGAIILRKVSWRPLFIVYLIISIIMVGYVLLNIKTGQGANARSIFESPHIAFMLPVVGFFVGPMLPTMCSVILTRLPKNKQSLMTSIIIIFGALEVSFCSKITGVLFGWIGGIKAFTVVTIIPFCLLIVLISIYSFVDRASDRK